MSNEIKAAAERWRNGRDSYEMAGGTFWHGLQRQMDALLLADAYIADQARREREQVERALPIDEAWLMSIGFRKVAESCFDFRWVTACLQKSGLWAWWVGQDYLSVIYQQRGQVLDLLSALQINMKVQT